MIQSRGVLVKTPSITIWQGRTDQWPANLDLGFRWASYGAIYRSHLWVAVLVNKIANATARLPLKVYERNDDDRPEARGHPYSELLRRPSKRLDPFLFWLWTRSTIDVYGEAFWGKVRDRGGRPVELIPLHPTCIHDEERDDKVVWWYDNGKRCIDKIERRDLVHFRTWNPLSDTRGMSPLEPLRSTLENEEGARKANSALWRNGGRPSVFLTHPKTLSGPAQQRLAATWSDIHGGVDNWAKAAVLEEGMEAKTIALNAEELQYIEARRLNREEACGVYDIPPPVVHILDRATFSNITEQMRSMYRDSMAPKLGLLESTLEFELRDGSFGDGEPDFGDGVYSEFLMDEVLRGDFEVRVASWATAIQTGQATMAEARKAENRPFIEGTDRLMVNAALTDATPQDEGMSVAELTLALQKIYLSVGTVITIDEARAILNRAGAGLNGAAPEPAPANVIPLAAVRSLMGRLSRQKNLDDIDPDALVAGLNGEAPVVLAVLAEAKAAGETVPQFRERLQALGGPT